MDSEDAMEAALNRVDDPIKWLNAENTRRRISRLPQISMTSPEFLARFPPGGNSEPEESEQIEFNLPVSEAIPQSTFMYDTFKMVCQLMNQLESMGENLVAFGNEVTGETKLSGETHTLAYDPEANAWVITEGRNLSD